MLSLTNTMRKFGNPIQMAIWVTYFLKYIDISGESFYSSGNPM